MTSDVPLFELESDPVASDIVNVNPCVRVFGLDPEGRRCKGCLYLYAKKMSKTYYKCLKRTITGGPGTDHRVGWDACSKYVLSEACGDCSGRGGRYVNDEKEPGRRRPGRPFYEKCPICQGRGLVAVVPNLLEED